MTSEDNEPLASRRGLRPEHLNQRGEEDLASRTHPAMDRTGYLRAADPPTVTDGNFADAQAVLHHADLHLDGPAVAAIVHVQMDEAGPADGAEGTQVRASCAREHAQQPARQTISKAL